MIIVGVVVIQNTLRSVIVNKISELLTMTELEVYACVCKFLQLHGVKHTAKANYIVTQMHNRPTPLICTHLDTISIEPPKVEDLVFDESKISLAPESEALCLGADDRAGVWIALQMIENGTETDFEYGFFRGEERGGIGSYDYAKLGNPEHTCFIGLDRTSKGGQHVASYGMDNSRLIEPFLALNFEVHRGSFTDCSVLSEELGMACLNVSVGYHREHSKNEYLDVIEMDDTLQVMQSIIIEGGDYEIEWDTETDDGGPIVCSTCGKHEPLYMVWGCGLCKDCADNYLVKYGELK